MENEKEIIKNITHLETLRKILLKSRDLSPSELTIKNAELYRIDKELKYIRSEKEWTFDFDGGGWNTIMAVTKQEAYKKAKLEYKYSKGALNPLQKSFRIVGDEEYKNLLSLFN